MELSDQKLCFTDTQIRHEFAKKLGIKEKSRLLNLLNAEINKKNQKNAFPEPIPEADSYKIFYYFQDWNTVSFLSMKFSSFI